MSSHWDVFESIENVKFENMSIVECNNYMHGLFYTKAYLLKNLIYHVTVEF